MVIKIGFTKMKVRNRWSAFVIYATQKKTIDTSPKRRIIVQTGVPLSANSRKAIGGWWMRMRWRKTFEAEEQMEVIKWAELMVGKYPCLKYLYHTPNGGSRNIAEAVHLKKMGVKAGVPDLCLPYPSNGHHGLYIEMKKDGGRLTAAQRDYLSWLNLNGYKAVMCKGAQEAIDVLWNYVTENVKEYEMLESENRKQGVYIHDSTRA